MSKKPRPVKQFDGVNKKKLASALVRVTGGKFDRDHARSKRGIARLLRKALDERAAKKDEAQQEK